MDAAIFSVGTELLMGDIVNTNAAYLSKELAVRGIRVLHQYTVGDNVDRMTRLVKQAMEDHDLLIFSGGLGPTDDDLTREVLAEVFHLPLSFNEQVWDTIVTYLGKKGQTDQISENNKKQAMVPRGARILDNPIGTAPGLWLTQSDHHAILLPGPPREMTRMFVEQVVPDLEPLLEKKMVSTYIRFFGIGESALENLLKDVFDSQTNPSLALYAKSGEVMMRVTASGDSPEECQNLIDQLVGQLNARVGKYIYLIGDQSVAQKETMLFDTLAKTLLEGNISLATAESLTGGLIASQFVSIPGISAIFLEGLVTYSYQAKAHLLGVDLGLLEKKGAVSPQVAEAMVQGLINSSGARAGIATTGVAGPDSDSNGNPVGLVYIATAFDGQIIVKDYQLYGDREMIRHRASLHAVNQLRNMIENQSLVDV